MKTHCFILFVSILIYSIATAQTKLDDSIKLINEGRYDEAKSLLQQITKETPGNASGFYYLGYITMGYDYDQSIKYLEAAVRLDYNNAKYHFMLGNAYGMKAARGSIFGKFGAAGDCLEQFKMAAQMDPKYIDPRKGLINYYLQAPGIMGGSVDKAKAEADTIKMFDKCEGYLAEAGIHEYEKEIAEQERCYKAALEVDPKNLSAYRGLLWLYWGRNDDGKAKDTFSKGIKSVEKKGELYYSAGFHYMQLKDFTKAFDMFRNAIGDDSTNMRFHYQFAVCAISSGADLQEGMGHLRKCLEVEPGPVTWPFVHWRMGMIYKELGDKTDAKSEYETALKMNSHLDMVKKSLEELK